MTIEATVLGQGRIVDQVLIGDHGLSLEGSRTNTSLGGRSGSRDVGVLEAALYRSIRSKLSRQVQELCSTLLI